MAIVMPDAMLSLSIVGVLPREEERLLKGMRPTACVATCALFFGAAAYGIMHSPQYVARTKVPCPAAVSPSFCQRHEKILPRPSVLLSLRASGVGDNQLDSVTGPSAHNAAVRRRHLLARWAVIAAAGGAGVPAVSAKEMTKTKEKTKPEKVDPFAQTGMESPESTFLRSRLDDSSVQQRGKALPFSPNQLYYPPWVFGEYEVAWTLRQKTFPKGAEAVPTRLRRGGSFRYSTEDVGDELVVRARYFSTLADSWENNIRVNLGLGAPSASIIEDRAFNAMELAAAAAEDVTDEDQADKRSPSSAVYEPRTDATLLSLNFPAGDDVQAVITNRLSSAPSHKTWLASESVSRTSHVGGDTRNEEYEEVFEWTLADSGDISGRHRTIVYLTRGDVLSSKDAIWTAAKGQAVAMYDYDVYMRRLVDEDGSVCVDTPKGYRQCQPPLFWRAPP